jgi:hypothetical protein
MPTKYKPKPVEAHKIDYGTAKSHWMNLRFKNGQPSVAGGDIKKGTSSYNEVVHLQQTLKEKDFVLLLAELADRSPTHWSMAAKYWEKRGWEVQIAGEVLADAKQFYTNEPPVSVIIQETKELSPAPIPIVLQETKKPAEFKEYGFLWYLKNTFNMKSDEYFTKYFPYNPGNTDISYELSDYIESVDEELSDRKNMLDNYDFMYPGKDEDDKNELRETIKIVKDEKNKKTKLLKLYEQQKEDWFNKFKSLSTSIDAS